MNPTLLLAGRVATALSASAELPSDFSARPIPPESTDALRRSRRPWLASGGLGTTATGFLVSAEAAGEPDYFGDRTAEPVRRALATQEPRRGAARLVEAVARRLSRSPTP